VRLETAETRRPAPITTQARPEERATMSARQQLERLFSSMPVELPARLVVVAAVPLQCSGPGVMVEPLLP